MGRKNSRVKDSSSNRYRTPCVSPMEQFQEEETKRIILLPKNKNQELYIKALKEAQQTVVLGPAGTGKTFIAATYAAKLISDKEVSKIILTRPNVSSGKSIGFFPGTLEEKMAPWLGPVVDVLTKHLGSYKVQNMIKLGVIQVIPFETMRGRSFEDAFVLLDEAQNTTPHEMKMFLTRIGDNSRVVMNGDIQQSDLPSNSGLAKSIDMIKKYDIPVPIIEFQVEDIVRSRLCKTWIEAFIKEDKH